MILLTLVLCIIRIEFYALKNPPTKFFWLKNIKNGQRKIDIGVLGHKNWYRVQGLLHAFVGLWHLHQSLWKHSTVVSCHLHLISTSTGETFSTDLEPSLNDIEVDRQGASLSYPSANGYYDNYYNNYYKTDQGMPSSSFHSWLIKSWKKGIQFTKPYVRKFCTDIVSWKIKYV